MDNIFPAIGRAIVDMRVKMNYRGPDK
jgi:hypothetical protein